MRGHAEYFRRSFGPCRPASPFSNEIIRMNRFSGIIVALMAAFVLFVACGRKGPDTPPDMIPPVITATDPGTTNNSGVPIDTVIRITFSEPVNRSTITFTLAGGGRSVPCEMNYSNTTATLTPRSPLSLNAMYTASVRAGVRDMAGNAMSSDYSWIFMTGRAPTTTQISAPAVTYNANGIVTVTVGAIVGTPSGGVSLTIDGGAATMQGLTGGSTTFTISKPDAGSHSLNAIYAKQGDFEESSASGTLVVNQAGTTTNITAPSVTYGEDGIVTVAVSSTAGTPPGNVSLSVDTGAATTKPLINGSATFTISRPSAGSHTLQAAYAAQGNHGASSGSGTLGVGAWATSMTLSAPGVTYNADGIVTVTVSSTSGTPTGDVSLRLDNGAVLMTQTLDGGSAIFTIPGPGAGSHSLDAAYDAQGNYGASSASGALAVDQAGTTTDITAPSVTYGEDGIVTVTVSSTAGIPEGAVQLNFDDVPLTPQALVDGSAVFTIPRPAAGSHTLNAGYAEQGNYGASSDTGTLGVGAGATSMTLIAPGVTYAADGIVTVTVSSTAGTPTGDVSLSINGGAAMTQPLSNGSTTFTIPSPAAGIHTLNAAYDAQGNYGASSASGDLAVDRAGTTTDITAPSVSYGEAGIVTVTVSSTAGIPEGAVQLNFDSVPLPQQALIGGSAVITTPVSAVGIHTLDATYPAQGNFGASMASGTLTVNAPDIP